jgi:hypothetical protein
VPDELLVFVKASLEQLLAQLILVLYLGPLLRYKFAGFDGG